MTYSVVLNFLLRIYRKYIQWYENSAINGFFRWVSAKGKHSVIGRLWKRFSNPRRKAEPGVFGRFSGRLISAVMSRIKAICCLIGRKSKSGVIFALFNAIDKSVESIGSLAHYACILLASFFGGYMLVNIVEGLRPVVFSASLALFILFLSLSFIRVRFFDALIKNCWIYRLTAWFLDEES